MSDYLGSARTDPPADRKVLPICTRCRAAPQHEHLDLCWECQSDICNARGRHRYRVDKGGSGGGFAGQKVGGNGWAGVTNAGG